MPIPSDHFWQVHMRQLHLLDQVPLLLHRIQLTYEVILLREDINIIEAIHTVLIFLLHRFSNVFLIISFFSILLNSVSSILNLNIFLPFINTVGTSSLYRLKSSSFAVISISLQQNCISLLTRLITPFTSLQRQQPFLEYISIRIIKAF